VETYIVRVWSDGPSTDQMPDAAIRGLVRHVREGRETMFDSWEELRALLAEPSTHGDLPSEAGGS
jgi:hypothetical protein